MTQAWTSLGVGANALLFAAAQLALAGVAAYDVATRRIPNAVTASTAVIVLGLRAAFERSVLGETLIAGAGTLALFVLLALASRGGLGMGDAKLAGVLGLLLGDAVLPALLIATLAGGVASVAIAIRSPSSLRRTIAYGPYLCLGGAVALLALQVPPLV